MNHLQRNASRIFTGLILLAGAAWILLPSASAQNAPTGPGGPPPMHWRGPGGRGAMGFGRHGFAKVVTGAPYTAQAVTTMAQTLSDGSHITRQVTATIARDSEGRTMRSQVLNGFGAAGGGQNGATIVTIFDPVANQRIEYNTTSKRARVFILPQKQGAASGGPDGSSRRHFHSSANVQTESLGAKTLSGVSVQGTMTTRTIPAGKIGNDKALQSTEEAWYSPDLQMVIASTRNDPRFGQTTYAVTNIQQHVEPPASLFQVPAGYTTKTVDLPSHTPEQ